MNANYTRTSVANSRLFASIRGHYSSIEKKLEQKRSWNVKTCRKVASGTLPSLVVCVPVYSKYHEIGTQLEAGVDEGLKHDSAACCDALVSIHKSLLTAYIGALSAAKMQEVNAALRTALAIG
jgi:mRNA interferase MazF